MLKKLFISFTLAMAVVANGLAAVPAPSDERGLTLPSIDFVGASYCTMGPATGTVPVLCTSGRGVVYGVIVTSDIANNFMILRDSTGASASPSSFTAVYAAGTGSNVSGVSTTQLLKFPVPIQFSNGLCATMNVAIPSNGVWTLLYRTFTTSN